MREREEKIVCVNKIYVHSLLSLALTYSNEHSTTQYRDHIRFRTFLLSTFLSHFMCVCVGSFTCIWTSSSPPPQNSNNEKKLYQTLIFLCHNNKNNNHFLFEPKCVQKIMNFLIISSFTPHHIHSCTNESE